MIIRLPPVTEILDRWREIAPLLQRATVRTHGCYEPEDVLASVMAGRGTMLLIEDDERLLAVAVTEIRIFPRKRVLDVGFLGGAPGNDTGVREWAPLLVERLEGMAHQIGATLITGCGRVGWARVGGFRLAGGFVARHVATVREQDNE